MLDRTSLECWLGEGLSLDEIGRRAARHPSTVGYWLGKHGLTAAHASKYSPKGGIDRVTLSRLVREHGSIRAIASALAVSPTTVRYWLDKHELQTARQRAAREQPMEPLPRYVTRRCGRHGQSRFVLEGRGYYRCTRCRSAGVAAWRRSVKKRLVAEAGGCCAACGYSRYPGALEFHHIQRGSKEFGLSVRGFSRSLEAARAEARKCVLLCANCHAEVEGGIRPCPGGSDANLGNHHGPGWQTGNAAPC